MTLNVPRQLAQVIMADHPCHQHRTGQHTTACMTGMCGFCDTDLSTTASGECRSCLLIVCESCDAGYDADLGPICQPCQNAGGTQANTPPEGPWERRRRCVFDLDLSCGHVVTYAVTGWYPVSVACCDRLGGIVLDGKYVAYCSQVDYVRRRSERYLDCPAGTPPRPSRVLRRRSRTDDPSPSSYPGWQTSSGRFPARVGAVAIRGASALHSS
ncbi:hypothetical protein GCM10010172_31310 [Paractinoplanes ferrugineus]|uniref:Uncharacterized protein n=1 Tax=Paractinoplanes ferrugineus TaxID=113564 RepID=A0A919MNE1_9ACTN|nr:hypothetical protein [Actinoplanes ferrugineus]GIE14177.1 hypothetical protein Afe05nite_60170 [Actinoplanes ferrugineus]